MHQLDKTDLIHWLTCRGEEEQQLFARAKEVRDRTLGNGVYLRGLIEISNVCTKDCLYCGIRKSNPHVRRYTLNETAVTEAAAYAFQHHYGSVVLQGGERKDPAFVRWIENIIREIKRLSNHQIGITLSLGEQSEAVYRRWFEAGAHRYLLRIETTNEQLYQKIHPQNPEHDFHNRLNCLERLQKCGYQTGTGIMIGLPFQTTEDLANDLLFFQSQDIDMVGMGPYLEHRDTPLWNVRHLLSSQQERLRLGWHMIACLRLLMPDINIAATTALQAIDPEGREKALAIGANVLMPNITPLADRAHYRLYENKPGMDEGAEASSCRLIESVKRIGGEIKPDEWGDSQHFRRRISSANPLSEKTNEKVQRKPELPSHLKL